MAFLSTRRLRLAVISPNGAVARGVSRKWIARLGGLLLALASTGAAAEPGLLFRASGDRDAVAEVAGGDPIPNFLENVSVVADGRSGGAFRQEDDGAVAWNAPGNIYAQRGTVSFFWRPRTPATASPFVIFRVGFAAHSSFDMAFLRIDWNGHGFDAFVTDANLSRIKVSFRADRIPPPDSWTHVAVGWDEAQGLRLFVDGMEVARNTQTADLDSGLDQLGLAGRALSPHQVHSRYNFTRGSDVDELRVYDRLLGASDVAALSRNGPPPAVVAQDPSIDRPGWLHRYGWEGRSPPGLTAPSTRIRKVEFADARDQKEWMWKGVDGIPETTWPGVYNRSRLPGRDDHFVLPDWNVYVEGGKNYDLEVPAAERFNRLEIRGAAWGVLSYAADGAAFRDLAKRPQGPVRTVMALEPHNGGRLRFANAAQETPIQEIWAYDVEPGAEPQGRPVLSYTVRSGVGLASDALAPLRRYIAGRFPQAERSTVVALPAGAPRDAAPERPAGRSAPIVHVLVPSRFDASAAGRPVSRSWNYSWQNFHSGLDGIAIDIPAMKVTPAADGLVPLNLRIKDPIWPGRDMIDVSFSVKPGEARTVWLDLRDRILTDDSLWISLASGSPDFDARSIDGLAIRMVFKPRNEAMVEHVADRFNQVKDNWSFLVEARPATLRAGLYRRLNTDISDLLRVAPDHELGRLYWQEISYGTQDGPPFEQPRPPEGVPLWAFRQLEDLKLVGRFVNWWIDERQVPYGDFGGGISDDTDLVSQWPGLALMGVAPDKIRTSLNTLADAVYKNGMIVNGLGAIATDELHAYEEGLNSDATALYLNWGDPLRVERLMATTKALDQIVTRNPAGHRHFSTNWYGAHEAHREGPWEWQKLYSFTVMHGPILLGVYNGSPPARSLVTETIDGLLAHGKQDAGGRWSFPNEINWRTDAERVGDTGGTASALQSAWAAWRWSGDERYLRPILSGASKSGPGSMAELNENLIDVLGRRADWGAALTAAAPKGGAFAQYAAWLTTGDKTWLERLHARAIQDKSQRMYMVTEGHWWTDRVEQPSEILQRERLGGVALKRNWTYPGHTVSWRFAEPDGAEQVALLVRSGAQDRFQVTGFNVSDRPQSAVMTTWGVAAGRWRMTAGPDADGDGRPDTVASTKEVVLERSASIDVSFPPKASTAMEFVLLEPGSAPEGRPDLAIGSHDLRVTPGGVEVVVHSLGAKPAAGGSLILEDSAGAVLARMPIPTLAAPADLTPKTWRTRLKAPGGKMLSGARVRVALGEPEVTLANNNVVIP
jgi:hypothetical protein